MCTGLSRPGVEVGYSGSSPELDVVVNRLQIDYDEHLCLEIQAHVLKGRFCPLPSTGVALARLWVWLSTTRSGLFTTCCTYMGSALVKKDDNTASVTNQYERVDMTMLYAGATLGKARLRRYLDPFGDFLVMPSVTASHTSHVLALSLHAAAMGLLARAVCELQEVIGNPLVIIKLTITLPVIHSVSELRLTLPPSRASAMQTEWLKSLVLELRSTCPFKNGNTSVTNLSESKLK